ANYVRTEFIEIVEDGDIIMHRGVNAAQSIAFYSSPDVADWISSVSGGADPITSITPPSGAKYMMTNPSTVLATRVDDLATFKLYQKGYSAIDTINGNPLEAKRLSTYTG